MSSIFRAYHTLLHKYPVVFQSVQTGLLMTTGDFLAQTVVEKTPIRKLNYKRSAQFFIVGTFCVGPMLTVWYRILERQFGSKDGNVAVKKMLLDQIVFSPCGLLMFLTTMNILQRKSMADLKHQLHRDYVDVLVANYKVWPPIQLANFYLIPLNYQVLVVQSVALLWNTYLSWKTQRTD